MSTSVFEKLEEKGFNYTVCLIAAEHFRGDALLAQKKIKEALVLYENCVNIGESVSLFRGLGLALAKAAFCLMLLGRYKEAEVHLQRMGKIYNIMHTEWEDGLQGGGLAFSIMGRPQLPQERLVSRRYMFQRGETPRQRSEAPALAGDALLGDARTLQNGRRTA